MAGMFVADWAFGPSAIWELIFAVLLVWFVVQSIQSVIAFGIHLTHYLIHAAMSFAMLLMYVFPAAARSGAMSMSMSMTSSNARIDPGLSLLLAFVFFASVIFTLASPNKGASHHGTHARAYAMSGAAGGTVEAPGGPRRYLDRSWRGPSDHRSTARGRKPRCHGGRHGLHAHIDDLSSHTSGVHWFGSPDATLSPVLSATEVVKTLQFVSVGAALVEGSEEDGHLRGRQRVRKADKCSAGIAVGRQSLAHDDGGVGPPNPNGPKPDEATIHAAAQESLVDEAVQHRGNGGVGMRGKCISHFTSRRFGIG